MLNIVIVFTFWVVAYFLQIDELLRYSLSYEVIRFGFLLGLIDVKGIQGYRR